MHMIGGIGIASDGFQMLLAAMVAMENWDVYGKESHAVVVVIVEEAVDTK